MDARTLKRRVKQAAQHEKRMQTIFNNLDKIPSFKGKAAFMDQVIVSLREAHNLHQNLKMDLAHLV